MNAFKTWLECECCICGEVLTAQDVVCIAHKIGLEEPAHCDCVEDVVADLELNARHELLEWEASR